MLYCNTILRAKPVSCKKLHGGGRARYVFLIVALSFLMSVPLFSAAGGVSAELILEKQSSRSYQSPVIGDADNDGQNELLSSVSLWFEGCGRGSEVVKYDWGQCYGQTYCPTWRAGIPIEQSPNVNIAVGNLDLDPDNELVIANATASDVNADSRLTIWKHTTGDDYDSCWSITVGHITDLDIGDCDHDGQNELVVAYAHYERQVKIFKRVGDCQYEESYSIDNGKDNLSVTVADCDNDDSLEIVITPSVWGTSADVWEYRNGSYQLVWSYPLDSGPPYTLGAKATVGDVDNDGDNEILVTAWGGGNEAGRGIYIFEHTVGDSYELDWSETGPDKGSIDPFIADILNDGGNEFSVVRDSQLFVYSDTGSDYDTVVVQQLPTSVGWNGVYVGDSDNDGKNEVVVAGNSLLAYEGTQYICGDANGDGVINVTDVVYLINYLFLVPPGPAPKPWAAGDVNCDSIINVTDVVYLINYLFLVPPGPPPCR